MVYTTFSSPLGVIVVATDGQHLTDFRFEGQRYFTSIPKGWVRGEHPLFAEAHKQTNEYFAGRRKKFDLPLSPSGTEFQKSVWALVSEVPYGELTTYGQVAEKIGNSAAVRAVGSAIGRNPLCIVVPCHRVVSADGTLSGYAGGVERKQRILALEGSLR